VGAVEYVVVAVVVEEVVVAEAAARQTPLPRIRYR
jgi:hypothetical protein